MLPVIISRHTAEALGILQLIVRHILSPAGVASAAVGLGTVVTHMADV